MRTIIWEDLNIETNILTGFTEEIENDKDSELDEDYLEDQEEISPEQIITSPFGIYHIKDFFNPMRQYKWNMAHTNFDISKMVLDIIVQIPGVERVVVLSRYRFLIAFGKAFLTQDVKDNIYSALKATQPLSEEALNKKKDLKDVYDTWAIYYLNDKKWWYADESNYEEKIKEFREKQKENGGLVITHETDI